MGRYRFYKHSTPTGLNSLCSPKSVVLSQRDSFHDQHLAGIAKIARLKTVEIHTACHLFAVMV